MKRLGNWSVASAALAAIMLGCLGQPLVARAGDSLAFWDTPRHGANSFNQTPPDAAYFQALSGYGATWVRMTYDKWAPERRDFLIGDADDYQGLSAKDLATLKAALDRADAAGLKVVITPLSLPGARWRQNNGGQFDDRLWRDKRYWTQTAAFWRDLALALKDHPGVAAYNLINEPAPELKSSLREHADLAAQVAWRREIAGSTRDLPLFYQTVIAAIREIDPLTPIMVDAGFYGAADGFGTWPEKLGDPRVLYSFHMYEPYEATSAPNQKRAKPYGYPGVAPLGGVDQSWDRDRVAAYLTLPLDWAKARGVAENRLVAGEFGCMRRWSGCGRYLEDVAAFLTDRRLHWAFYSFREDVWDGMDYELGDGPPPANYWSALEAGRPGEVKRTPTPLFEPIRKRLAK